MRYLTTKASTRLTSIKPEPKNSSPWRSRDVGLCICDGGHGTLSAMYRPPLCQAMSEYTKAQISSLVMWSPCRTLHNRWFVFKRFSTITIDMIFIQGHAMNPHTQSHKQLILNQGSSTLGTGNQTTTKPSIQNKIQARFHCSRFSCQASLYT